MSNNLDTQRSQIFNAYYKCKQILRFTIAPLYKIYCHKETFHTQDHTDIDSLITELQEWKSKGITEIGSWGWNDSGGYSYEVEESDECLEKRKDQYEIDLKEQEKAYNLAFSICHLISVGDFAEADRKLTVLRNTKWMYNLKE